jgi:hypothetical protein
VNEKAWRLAVPTAAFDNLLCRPRGGGMPRHMHVANLSVGVMDDEEHVQCSKRDGLDAEEIARPDSDACYLRNDRQVLDGPRRWLRCIYLATVLAETLNPSRASSAWIRRCPQSVFSMVMRRIRVRSSGAIGHRPGFPLRLERRRQYVRHL